MKPKDEGHHHLITFDEDDNVQTHLATFHLHTPEGSLLEPSAHDILTVHLLGLPDVIVHRDGLCVYRPMKRVDARKVWEVDKECWVESDGDYWAWKACLITRLPIDKKIIRF